MFKFNVRLHGKTIDGVFYNTLPQKTIRESCEDIKRSLINHDGYDPDITVTWPKGQRVTVTTWELEGNYGQGWELLTAGTTYSEVKANREDYRKNAPCPMRIVKRMERK